VSPGEKIRPRERDAILNSLGAGIVPRVGQQHIQVGRAKELAALVEDIDRIAEGGSAIRFVIGEYGSGKTFFLQLIRSVAMEKRLVTAHADLTPDRRLHATGGQARSLYAELMRNLATRSKPEGGALPSIVERFIAKHGEGLHHLSIEAPSFDDTIAAYAKGWTVDRIAPLDMNVMRVALYEMDFMDTPAEVAINEAVEIAKEYCGADAPGFVNGILGAVAREREPAK